MIGRRDNQKQTFKKVAIGSGIAAAAGYIAGILTAPKSGKQTRNDIKVAGEKGLAEGEKELKKLHTELDKAISQAKASSKDGSAKAQKELKELVGKAKVAKDKSREVLSALHEGDASDEDLAKAVKQAKHAIANLKAYLKK